MKVRIIILLGLFFPFWATAQTVTSLAPEVGGRVAVSIDKKIVKGLHVSLEEEARFDNNFRSFDRLQTNLELKYKVHRNIKLGMGYAMINGYDADTKAFKGIRHRLTADITGTLHLGQWNLALKERFQTTWRTGNYNPYQNPKAALMLKSRLSVRYKGFAKVEPYLYFEMRNYLNAPVISAAYDGINYGTIDGLLQESEPGWFLSGFKGGYVNRLRGSLGVDVKIDKRNTLNFHFMGDYCIDKVVDANAEGTILKSYTKEKGFRGWFGAGYEFAF